MPKPENAGYQGQGASSKPNQGQDEKLHTFVNSATGATQQATMREYKATLKDQGFTKPDEADEVAEPTQPETPA